MRKRRSLVFISHIKEEKIIALKLQDIIKQQFQNEVEVFVSTDRRSIKAGKDWLPQIKNALRGCSIEIVLCSKFSIDSRWINFEAGAGWIMDIRVIPLCFNGMDKGKLPVPFSSVQAKNLNDQDDFQDILDSISEVFGLENREFPKFDWKPLTDTIVIKRPLTRIKDFVTEFVGIIRDLPNNSFENLLQDRNDLYRLKKSDFIDLVDLANRAEEYGLGKYDLVIKEEFIESDGGVYRNAWTFADVVISKRFRNELEKHDY